MIKVKTVIFFLAFILISFSACDGLLRSSDNELDQKLINTVDRLVKENDLPGLNLSLIYKNGTQENYTSGFADIDTRLAMTSEHVMFSGSVGKTYAAAIIFQLIDEGKIKLSDKYIDYFPEVSWLSHLPNIRSITIDMLLRHTTGLPRYVLKPEIWDSLSVHPDKVWTYEDRLSVIFHDTAVHEAGKGWAYSDTNYILLGMLIEKVTGNQYYDEVSSRLLIIENLASTYPAIRRDINSLPVGYSNLPEMFKMPEKVVNDGEFVFNPQMEWTGGGMASTTSDLANWAKIYYGGSLFSDSIMMKIVSPDSCGRKIEDSLSYGMGSFIYETKFGKAYGHTGFVPGFMSIFAHYPEAKISLAMQINCDYATKKLSLTDYLDEIMSTLYLKNEKDTQAK